MKLLADAVKWTAGISTLLVATSASLIGGKLQGGFVSCFLLALILLLLSACFAGLHLAVLAAGIAHPNQNDESENKFISVWAIAILGQIATFFGGLVFYGIALYGSVIYPKT